MVAGRGVSVLFLVGTLVCTWIGSGSLFGGAGPGLPRGLLGAVDERRGLDRHRHRLLPRRPGAPHRPVHRPRHPRDALQRRGAAARHAGHRIAYLTIAGYQFIGGGRLLNLLVPGITPFWGQAIVCGLVILYTVMAGMTSIVALDLINGLLITGRRADRRPARAQGGGRLERGDRGAPRRALHAGRGPGRLGAALGLFFPTFFLLLGESSMYQKFMSARDERLRPASGHRHDPRGGGDRGGARLDGDLRRRHPLGGPRLPRRRAAASTAPPPRPSSSAWPPTTCRCWAASCC